MPRISKAHMESNARYDSKHARMYSLKVIDTSPDVIAQLDEVENRNGYIVSLVRSDRYRRFSNHLILHGKDLTYQMVSKYAEEIERIYPTFRQLADPQALSYVESQFVENTPAHVIVSEYLRSTETDPIIIE